MDFNKVLVTGGAGFLGSNLVNRLHQMGKDVIIFDNGFRMGFGNFDQVTNHIELIKGDITVEKDWDKLPTDIDYVFHLGAINGTKYFYEMPEVVLQTNILGTFRMLDWIRKTNAQGFFFASSSEVYGYPKKFPTSEEQELSIPDPENPRFSYSSSKITGELLCINFAKKLGLTYHIGRFHNIYGPKMGFEHVIPEFIQKLVMKNEFTVQGDGGESRCFCFISDAIDGITTILGSKGTENQIFNIGTDEETTIAELIKKLEILTETKIKPIYKKFKNPGTRRRVPDITKLKKFGYQPKIPLSEGLAKTYEWYHNWILKNNMNKK